MIYLILRDSQDDVKYRNDMPYSNENTDILENFFFRFFEYM
jgi:hypothetical protein